MFKSNAFLVSVIQYTGIIFAVIGLFIFEFNLVNFSILMVFYFLYSGVGVSLTLHRYYTHRSFEFKNKIIKWFCIWFAIMAGRGSPLGWVYVHRLHHKYPDQKEDPHTSSLKFKTMWFPNYDKFVKEFNFRIVKDLLNNENMLINNYYFLYILIWAIGLYVINPELFFFGWVLPVVMTHFSFNTFLYVGHKIGYRNHDTSDCSKNSWPYAILLWGEGWHNNHHHDPKKYNLREHWWEIDIIGSLIYFIKK